MPECDCLRQYDASLGHDVMCPLGDSSQGCDPIRELAEMAAYRDISAALMAYRQAKKLN